MKSDARRRWSRLCALALAAAALAGGWWCVQRRTTARSPLHPTTRVLEAAPVVVAGHTIPPSPLDRTCEVRAEVGRGEDASVVVVGSRGEVLAPPVRLERVPSAPSLSRALVPLRALAPFTGPARALVLAGAHACLDAALLHAEVGKSAAPGVRLEARRCGAVAAEVNLADDFGEPFAPQLLDDAERRIREGDPALALNRLDRARGSVPTSSAARADAIAGEAALALGRNVLARDFALRGLRSVALTGPLEARLLRIVVLARDEAERNAESARSERERLAASEKDRPGTAERLLDAALDLRVALDHDRFPGPPLGPAAARRLADIAAIAEDVDLGPVAPMVCRAADALEGATADERSRLVVAGSLAAEHHGSLADRAYCAFAAAESEREHGDLAQAELLATRSVEILGDHALPREQREAWFTAAHVAAMRGRGAEAFALAKVAYGWVDVALSFEVDMSERAGLLGDTFGYYGDAGRFAAAAGDARGAIASAEWGKARAFGALLRDVGDVEAGGAGTFFIAHGEAGSPESHLDDFARSLAPGDAALSYSAVGASDSGEVQVVIGVVSAGRATARIVKRPTGLCSQIRALGRAVAGNDEADTRAIGSRLYDGLIRPVEPEIAGARRLFISPHLCLHDLPWAALYDGERFLIERAAIARVPPLVAALRTASDAQPILDPDGSGRWVLAHDALHPGAVPLPGLAPLVAEIAARVRPVSELAGKTLTPERFVAEMGRADSIFFAGHARYDPARPLASALLVSPSAEGFDRVEAGAIVGLSHPLDLVFLLGCETSRLNGAPADYSEEAMGLQRAFLAGGARHVLGALWPILDRDAEDFARAFFDQGRGLDAMSAVAAAQRCLLSGRCRGHRSAAWGSFLLDAR